MKNLFLSKFFFFISLCVFVACGSDDSSSGGSVPGNKNSTSGLFQINAGGTKVRFAPGNLQATYNGSMWTWAFAANQWDYVSEYGGNVNYNGANTYINGDGKVSANGIVDLFGWVGETSTWTEAAQYGISNSITVNNRYTYGNIASESLKSDWGNTISDGYTWRTLSFSEWTYVFNTRTSGSTVNGTLNSRYSYATINTDDRAVNGIILFPDGITLEANDATTWGKINSTSQKTECTSAQWASLAAKGCVFLPAAGYRYSKTVGNSYQLEVSVRDDGYGCYYWSSSSHTTDVYSAYAFSFDRSYLNPARSYSRPHGFSVRLVREVE